jgi:hypothetical protein
MSGRLLVAMASGAMAFAGCGAAGASDADQIRTLVADYGRALADGDGDRAFRMLTVEARAHVVRDNRYAGVRRCEDVADIFHALGSPEDLRELRRALDGFRRAPFLRFSPRRTPLGDRAHRCTCRGGRS